MEENQVYSINYLHLLLMDSEEKAGRKSEEWGVVLHLDDSGMSFWWLRVHQVVNLLMDARTPVSDAFRMIAQDWTE